MVDMEKVEKAKREEHFLADIAADVAQAGGVGGVVAAKAALMQNSMGYTITNDENSVF